MTWYPILKRFKFAAFIVTAALSTAACQREAPRPVTTAWLVGGGDCAMEARLTAKPQKLSPIPIELVPRAGCPAVQSATVSIDMTNMKMNVAPVELREAGGKWRGELVFTMGGPWRIEVKAVDSEDAIKKGLKDVDVP